MNVESVGGMQGEAPPVDGVAGRRPFRPLSVVAIRSGPLRFLPVETSLVRDTARLPAETMPGMVGVREGGVDASSSMRGRALQVRGMESHPNLRGSLPLAGLFARGPRRAWGIFRSSSGPIGLFGIFGVKSDMIFVSAFGGLSASVLVVFVLTAPKVSPTGRVSRSG